MTRIDWDKVGERFFETGIDRGVLYIPNASGVYANGYGWNGLVSVTESPSGAESNPQYADNLKYLNLLSAEEFGGTIECFTYPPEWAQCDGQLIAFGGVTLAQQSRKSFGLAYRSLLGNDILGRDYGYKIHLIYGALASPSEKAFTTVNDSPEATTFSYELTTTPVPVGTVNSVAYKPVASLTIDSTKVTAANLLALEDAIYGTAGTDPRLPLPAEVITMFSGSLTSATPTTPTFSSPVITIPTVTGVDYRIDGNIVTGTYTIPGTTGAAKLVTATPKPLYTFPAETLATWRFVRT